MNQVIQQLHRRKSVRVYQDRPIEKDVKQAILEAALQAPTAGNMTLYTILDITDQAKKDALAISCDNQPFIATAPMVLIFCADYRRWYDVFSEYGNDARKPMVGDLFLAQADALIAAQNAVVAAESFGIGSCYIGDITENYEYHRQLLNLPQFVVPAAMLCFGYPTQQQLDRPKPPRFQVEAIVHENGYCMEKAEAMTRMLAHRNEKTPEELKNWLVRFCDFKWNSEFSREMSRSCEAMLRHWCGEKE